MSGKIQALSFALTFIALGLVYSQLRENTQTNKVAIRGQLLQNEVGLSAVEADDDKDNMATLWARVPPTLTGEAFGATLLRLVTDDPTAVNAKTAEELYRSMFNATTFSDPQRRKATSHLRHLFIYNRNTFYHIHNAHAYWNEKILTDAEWATWKNSIREMNAHPMLVTVIWHGHRNRYFSRAFGRFLQQELCADTVPPDNADQETYNRGKEFIRFFYPDMLKKDWANSLPDY